MRRIVEEIVVARMRHAQHEPSLVPADAIELLDDGDESVRALADMLERMAHRDFLDRIIGPRPGKGLEIPAQIGLAVFVDIAIARELAVAAAEVEFHRLTPPTPPASC
jgi:hypothetical protein